jgi:outer membrane assembly lipoprotein YfiO
MGHGRHLLVAGLLLVAAQSASAQTPTPPNTDEAWELQGDQWRAVNDRSSAPSVAASEPLLDRAEALIQQDNPQAARKLLVPWLLQNRRHPQRDRGIYLMGELYFVYGDRIRSFYYFDELMDEHPASPLFFQALQRQYDIADAYLNGYKIRFLGVPMFRGYDEAVEMLFRVQSRSPGSPLAEAALRRTADHYYASGDYELAADAYAVYASSYPRSPLVPRMRLRQAFSSYAQFHGVRFDATALLDARTQLVNLIQVYPKLAAEENLEDFVAQIDRNLARKLLVTGDFYRRTRQPAAAVYYWRTIEQVYPNLPEAAEATERLSKASPEALATAAPPAQRPASIRN